MNITAGRRGYAQIRTRPRRRAFPQLRGVRTGYARPYTRGVRNRGTHAYARSLTNACFPSSEGYAQGYAQVHTPQIRNWGTHPAPLFIGGRGRTMPGFDDERNQHRGTGPPRPPPAYVLSRHRPRQPIHDPDGFRRVPHRETGPPRMITSYTPDHGSALAYRWTTPHGRTHIEPVVGWALTDRGTGALVPCVVYGNTAIPTDELRGSGALVRDGFADDGFTAAEWDERDRIKATRRAATA